jgi:hypothetical protein
VPADVSRALGFQAVVVQEASRPDAKVALTASGLERARREMTPAVDVLLWPGRSWPGDPFATGKLEPELRFIAAAFRGAFVFGCLRPVGGQLVPSVIAVGPHGQEIAERREGDAPWIIPCHEEEVGVLCGLEVADEDVCRGLARRGASVLLVSGDEPDEWPRIARLQHALHASLRACELRRPVVRAAPRGPSYGLDWIGRPYRHVPEGASGVIIARVSGDQDLTFYARAGWVLPHLATIASLVWLGVLADQVVRRRRSSAAADASR